MGWFATNNASDFGLTDEERELLEEYGESAGEYYDTYALSELMGIYEGMPEGFFDGEVYDEMVEYFNESEDFYAQVIYEETGIFAYFNRDDGRWHEVGTHQYVDDPYDWIEY